MKRIPDILVYNRSAGTFDKLKYNMEFYPCNNEGRIKILADSRTIHQYLKKHSDKYEIRTLRIVEFDIQAKPYEINGPDQTELVKQLWKTSIQAHMLEHFNPIEADAFELTEEYLFSILNEQTVKETKK